MRAMSADDKPRPDGPARRHFLRWHPDTLETLNAQPERFSPIVSTSRVKSLRYALAGWMYMLRYQKNTRIQAFASILVFLVGLWLGLPLHDWAVLVVVITMNWMAEFVNAALEAAVNLASPNLHPMARVGKDVGAAAVLLTSVAAVVVGALVLGPPLLARVEPWLIDLLRK